MLSSRNVFLAYGNSSSASHPRRLDRQSLRAPREVELEVEVLRRSVRQHLGADAGQARPQPPLERPQSLPLHPVYGVAVRVALADGLREQALAPVRFVAVRAREVHLAAAQAVRLLARVEAGASGTVDRDIERHAARLARDVGGDRQQLFGFVLVGFRTLSIDA